MKRANMNNYTVLFVLLGMIIATVSTAALDGPAKDCPAYCPVIYSPVCSRNSKGEFKTFDNECDMKSVNCIQNSNFIRVRSGACDVRDEATVQLPSTTQRTYTITQ